MRSAEDSQPLKFCGEKEGDQGMFGEKKRLWYRKWWRGKEQFQGGTPIGRKVVLWQLMERPVASSKISRIHLVWLIASEEHLKMRRVSSAYCNTAQGPSGMRGCLIAVAS